MSNRPLKSTIEVYEDSSKDWRWRIKHQNGTIIGASSEGYENNSECLQNLKSLGEHITQWASSEGLKDAINNMSNTKGI